MKKFAVIALLFWCNGVVAQDSAGISKPQKTKPAFQLTTAVGFLSGASGRDLQLQLVPALRYKTWSVGSGVGLDYYFHRTIPLFIDVRKLFQNPMPLFLYADAGWNLPWINKDNTQIWLTSHFKNGLYYDVGAGWQFKTGKRHAISCSAGYSAKKLTEVQKWLNIPPGADEKYYTSTLKYDLHRISIKVGFQL